MTSRFWSIFITVLVAGCITSELSGPERADTASISNTSSVRECQACIFGPRLYVRSTGSPKSVTSTFSADPEADYIIDIDDMGSQGANGTVELNGVTLYPSAHDGSGKQRHRKAYNPRKNTEYACSQIVRKTRLQAIDFDRRWSKRDRACRWQPCTPYSGIQLQFPSRRACGANRDIGEASGIISITTPLFCDCLGELGYSAQWIPTRESC